MSHLKEYKIYKGMKERCRNPNLPDYPNYGGRGIKIADEWLGPNGFKNFIAEVGFRPDPSMSIDRIDVNKNYEPGNCKWSTPAEQHKNRRKFVAISKYSDAEFMQEFHRRFSSEYGMSGC
jgi:hypothetical protein